MTELRKISICSIFKKGQIVRFALRTPVPNVSEYDFEITICDDFRLIKQDDHSPVVSKGMINYVVTTNGIKGSVQSDSTTLKKFFEKNYSKSDKTISPNFWDSIIDASTGNPISTLI